MLLSPIYGQTEDTTTTTTAQAISDAATQTAQSSSDSSSVWVTALHDFTNVLNTGIGAIGNILSSKYKAKRTAPEKVVYIQQPQTGQQDMTKYLIIGGGLLAVVALIALLRR